MTTDQGWRLTLAAAADADREDWWRRLPEPPQEEASRPEGYIADEALIDAFNTALLLGRPLLLTGDPGCGKTQAANYLAWKLGLSRVNEQGRAEHALRFDTKSTTTARDMFYSFDYVKRFYEAQHGGDTDPLNFVTLNALGRAIVEGSTSADAAALRAKVPRLSQEPRRSVVLIDEIDKAPRDVPNDLLVEMEKFQFFLAELDQTYAADAPLRPIILLTSNSERTLPDAFLRRCVFHAMPAPDTKRLIDIVMSRVEAFRSTPKTAADIVAVYERLRAQRLARKPGPAEVVDFAQALSDAGVSGGDLRSSTGWQTIARSTLLKNREDQSRAGEEFFRGLLAPS